MNFQKKTLATYIAALISGNALMSAQLVHAEEQKAANENLQVQTLDKVEVVGDELSNVTENSDAYAIKSMGTATKFNLSNRETPQSVSVMSRQRMDDFGLTNLNDVLGNTTGIIVEQVETNRAYYNARGFDIKNVQLDGVSIQNSEASGIVKGDMDTVIYDHVEVVRGANGLSTGSGTPSATINLVRKRPTEEFQASVSATAGSWDQKRLEADVSGTIVESGNVRARLVTAVEETDSHLDRYNLEKNIVYGVLDANITDNTIFTIGASQQKNQTDSPMWGSLPLQLSDGSETNYDRSTSSGSEWSYNDEQTRQLFAELSHEFSNGWTVKGVGMHNKQKIESDLLYVISNPLYNIPALPNPFYDPTNPAFGPQFVPNPYEAFQTAGLGTRFSEQTEQNSFDLYASGNFSFFGREHEAYFGTSYSKSNHSSSGTAATSFNLATADISKLVFIEDLDSWNGDSGGDIDRTTTPWGGGAYKDRNISTYGAVNLNLTDQLNFITGARVSDWSTKGTAFSGESKETTESGEVTPYAGLVFDITSSVSTYASYTEIFTPQNKLDRNGNLLGAIEGQSYEFGIKSSLLDDKLQASISYFNVEQDNVAVEDIIIGATQTYRAADGLSSKGFEIEFVGEPIHNLHASLGYTYQDMDASDDAGKDVTDYTPQQLVRFATSYRIPNLEKLKIGTSINWQDSTKNTSTAGQTTKQDSYALVNLMASYDVTDSLIVQANANNVTDEDYYASLKTRGYSYKGAPANYEVSARYNF